MTTQYTQHQGSLSPWYVTGLVDGEGMFGIYYSTQTSAQFKVTAHACNLGLLLSLQSFFGCGNISIDNRRDNTMKFVVTSLKDLQSIIIPHFVAFPLQGSKALNFHDFAKAVEMMANGAHLNATGLAELQLLTANMNVNRPNIDKYNFLSNTVININSEWVQGFIDGEGHFAVEINKPASGRTVPTIACSLQVAQASHDVLLLDSLKHFFGGTRIKPSYDIKNANAVLNAVNVSRLWVTQWITTSRSGLLWNQSPIILLFDRLPMLTTKQLDYLDWKTIVGLAAAQAHHTPSGLEQIKKLKAGMNRGRAKIGINDVYKV